MTNQNEVLLKTQPIKISLHSNHNNTTTRRRSFPKFLYQKNTLRYEQHKGNWIKTQCPRVQAYKEAKKRKPPPPVQQTDDYQEPPTTDTVKRYFLDQALLGRSLEKKFCMIIRYKEGDYFYNVDTVKEANLVLEECRKNKILNEKKQGAQRFAFTEETVASCEKVYFYADGDTKSKFYGFHTMIGMPKEEDEKDETDKTD